MRYLLWNPFHGRKKTPKFSNLTQLKMGCVSENQKNPVRKKKKKKKEKLFCFCKDTEICSYKSLSLPYNTLSRIRLTLPGIMSHSNNGHWQAAEGICRGKLYSNCIPSNAKHWMYHTIGESQEIKANIKQRAAEENGCCRCTMSIFHVWTLDKRQQYFVRK